MDSNGSVVALVLAFLLKEKLNWSIQLPRIDLVVFISIHLTRWKRIHMDCLNVCRCWSTTVEP